MKSNSRETITKSHILPIKVNLNI